MFGRKLISSVALASLFAFAVPSIALADDGAREGRGEEARQGKRDRAEKAFPMPAAKFQEHAEKRIAKVRARITERLADATPEKRQQVIAKLDAAEAQVRKAIDIAVKDGTVTREEAQKVREAAQAAREQAGLGKGRGGDGKGHGKGKGRGPAR